ncbi:hypothetical protein AB0442_27560 [Kitasatospora sp. NPDC085895]|uniref:hypothetical protein n=1 Tax=Kitasatospora sp. NPDC085895 TaxID=3155057 RepID=UPI00344B31A0
MPVTTICRSPSQVCVSCHASQPLPPRDGSTPPRNRRGKYLEQVQWLMAHHERARFEHSSRRMPVEHGIACLKNWRTLARHHGRRGHLPDTIRAAAGLLSDQQAVHTHQLAALLAGRAA